MFKTSRAQDCLGNSLELGCLFPRTLSGIGK